MIFLLNNKGNKFEKKINKNENLLYKSLFRYEFIKINGKKVIYFNIV